MAEQRSYTGNFNNRWKFNGKELDEETGLYYYGARFYNPSTSLWLSVDPLAEMMPSFGGYTYNFNNPIRYTDPTGMMPEEGGGGDDDKRPLQGPLSQEQTELQNQINNSPGALLNPNGNVSNTDMLEMEQNVLDPITVFGRKNVRMISVNTENKPLAGYPGQALDDLATLAIQKISSMLSGSNVSREQSQNIQFATFLTLVIVNKGKKIPSSVPGFSDDITKWVSTEPGMQSTSAITDIMTKMSKNDWSVFAEPIKVVIIKGRTYILNGHHRVEAAKNLGYKTLDYMEIPIKEISKHSGFKNADEIVKLFGN